MNKYLSIGEVAKLKGVGIKSLRYYDALGILKPAYINPVTGYRYYLPSQLVLVDLISFCIRLDIPLKDLPKYIRKNKTIDVEKLLQNSREIVQKKMFELSRNICELEQIGKHLQKTQQIKVYNKKYTQTFDERYFCVEQLQDENCTSDYFIKTITSLYQKARYNGWSIMHNHGLIKYMKKEHFKTYAFLEIEKPEYLVDNILLIPQGVYSCSYFSDLNIFDAENYIDNLKQEANKLVIFRELYDVEIQCTKTPVEIQLFISN